MADNSLQIQSQNPPSFAPTTLEDAFKFAHMILISGMAPKAYMKPFDDLPKDATAEMRDDAAKAARAGIVVTLQFGMEVGFQPLQSLQSIANINGMPSIWGDGALALVKSKGLIEFIKEDNLQDIAVNKKATCTVKRKGEPNEHTVTFSYDDAEKAGIWGKNVWKTYPARMCQMRARAFALRNVFPDALKGLAIAEEVQDYQTIEAQATPAAQPKPQGQIKIPGPTAAETTLVDVLLPQKESAEVEPTQEGDTTASTTTSSSSESSDQTPAPTTEAKDEDHAPEDDPVQRAALEEEAKKWAVGYYQTYKAAGKTADESKAYLKKAFGIEDSRQVPSAKRDEAMAEAKAGFPSMKAEEKF